MKPIADLHTHTIASTHAYSTIGENLDAAKQRGLKMLNISDHAPGEDAPHIWHFGNMRHCFPPVIDGVYLLSGMEANLLPGGGIGWYESVLQDLDFVVCSQHPNPYPPTKDKKQNTADWLWACEFPYIDCLGHIGQSNYDFDHEAIVKACVRTDTLLEVNNLSFDHREKRETFQSWLGYCNRYDCPILVNSDAHSAYHIGYFEQAISFLEEIGFPEDLVLNTDFERLKQWIEKRHCGKPLEERGFLDG